MNRVLKNPTRSLVETTYNGKLYRIKPKGTLTLDHNGFDEQAADYLLNTFQFLREIPAQPVTVKPEVKEARPKKQRRTK